MSRFPQLLSYSRLKCSLALPILCRPIVLRVPQSTFSFSPRPRNSLPHDSPSPSRFPPLSPRSPPIPSRLRSDRNFPRRLPPNPRRRPHLEPGRWNSGKDARHPEGAEEGGGTADRPNTLQLGYTRVPQRCSSHLGSRRRFRILSLSFFSSLHSIDHHSQQIGMPRNYF